MTSVLKNENFLENCLDSIESIRWILKNEVEGFVKLETNKELSKEILNKISKWVSEQHNAWNSGSLGERWEQQQFIKYTQKEYDKSKGYYVTYEDDEEANMIIIASFDWEIHGEYEFSLEE